MDAMVGGDPDAKWLMQGWLFQDTGFWTPQAIEAYLGGVSNSDMIILDLYSDEYPIFSSTQSYFGKDFIWCMLHNFGGMRGIYGLLDHISTAPIETENNPSYTMIGTGITMEAIEQNPVVYTLMSEMAWRSKKFDTAEWLSHYVKRRYATPASSSPSLQHAWQLFHKSEYSQPWDGARKSFIESRPYLSMDAFKTPNITMFLQGWRMYLASQTELKNLNGPWMYDAVDLSRQVLSNFFVDVHALFTQAYTRSDYANALSLGDKLTEIIDYAERLLASNPNFLLGNWIEDAKSWAKNDNERSIYEFNARNQITLWGPTGQINDYASKAWSGLYATYYKRRWSFFIDTVLNAIQENKQFDTDTYDRNILTIEQLWGEQRLPFPTTPTDDTLSIISSIEQSFATSTSVYKVLSDTDAPGNDITQAWTRDLQQLQILCDLDTTCAGFNSNGWIKNTISTTVQSSSTLYIKVKSI
eukprot:TRINITY_DN715_c0_g1_i2.p1 TRINITY_DN715_c0_g1~~TRINITY_DN715_c0_g1_i2.p1  ORF type:complete len:538 (-),score=68.55 TRINITY_DN715_c0_g1_i2:92-1501(-)